MAQILNSNVMEKLSTDIENIITTKHQILTKYQNHLKKMRSNWTK